MVAKVRTLDFLPEIFRTNPNRQFLSATLDQLVSQPNTTRIQGYIGSKFGPGINSSDGYVTEPNKVRTDYQLEPSVAFLNKDTSTVRDVITYPGIIDALKLEGAVIDRNDRLFANQFYSWDSFIDLDKLINFNQYYWLSNGPDPVKVSTEQIYSLGYYQVLTNPNTYNFSLDGSAIDGQNPILNLVRGGVYTFDISQDSKFWIQGTAGLAGTDLMFPNISTREIYGLENNGISSGRMTFTVPQRNDQPYMDLPGSQSVDLVTDLRPEAIDGAPLRILQKIDGVTSLHGKTILFNGIAPLTKVYIHSDFYELSGFDQNLPYPNTYEAGIESEINKHLYLITYVGDPLDPIIKLTEYSSIIQNNKIKVKFGTKYSHREFICDEQSNIILLPYFSASLDTLYYQDSANADRVGMIRIIDELDYNLIQVDNDIIGKKSYTSQNGVEFTNGLKVYFFGNILPASYKDHQYYVEGVGSSIALVPVDEIQVYEPFSNSFYTPYDMVQYDSAPFDKALYIPPEKDYITINRNSNDRNAWSRGNRWFHSDVLRATARYNNTSELAVTELSDSTSRAKRPIIEFYPNLHLYKSGTVGKLPVDFINTSTVDPFGYSGVDPICAGALVYHPVEDNNDIILFPLARIIFAGATDPDVRNKIYVANFISIDGVREPTIVLTVAPDGYVEDNDQVVVSGDLTTLSYAGHSYYYTGSNWVETQLKEYVNQPPKFDIFNTNGISLGDSSYYQGSSFAGSTLFEYAIGTNSDDSVLGIPLKYSAVTNIGDIVFNVSLNDNTFNYTQGYDSLTEKVNIGYVHQYQDRYNYIRKIGWETAIGESIQYQVFDLRYVSGDPIFTCDIAAKTKKESAWPTVQVYVDSMELTSSEYTVTIADATTSVTLVNTPVANTSVQILVDSIQVSKVAYYKIPSNLENNPFNTPVEEINLGDIRNHYRSIFTNNPSLIGNPYGSNNFRDSGNLVPYGNKIIQSSASMIAAGAFLRSNEYNIFNALAFNATEYIRFKSLLIDTINRTDFNTYYTNDAILDNALEQISNTKNDNGAFFWTDMLPSKSSYALNSYKFVNFIDTTSYPLTRIYDFSTANYYGVLLYLTRVVNGVAKVTQLTREIDYSVSSVEPKVTLYTDLLPNDIITIKEYNQTYGSYIPSTPTKLGLYPAFAPEVIQHTSGITPTYYIKGHDGSLTKLYGEYIDGYLQDFRDRGLLEFEQRIYNNIKLSNVIPITQDDIMPGQFRTTDYEYDQIQQMYSVGFLNWVGQNRIDYKNQYYVIGNAWTYNYSKSTTKLGNVPVNQANWRGLYLWYYDTVTPDQTPWEMLGHTSKPTWWDTRYGVAPYTSDNTLLWDELARGYDWNNGDPKVITSRIRPDLLKVLPVDTYGKLVDPLVSIISGYEPQSFGQREWKVGDGSPAEYAYLKSSTWPFDLMRLAILTKPAKFFGLGIDVDQYEYNSEFNQYLQNARYRSPLSNLTIYGTGEPVDSYVNWIVDYIKQFGIDGHSNMSTLLTNLDVRLTYRLAGFSDKDLLKFYIEKGTPNSRNSSLLIPDESYAVLLYDNQPIDTIAYSSIIIQKTSDGYKVFGNSQNKTYFKTLTPKLNGNYTKFALGAATVTVSKDYTDTIQVIPYSNVYKSVQALCEFIVNYGRYLTSVGMIFDNIENNVTADWGQMVLEVLYWVQSGWEVGSTINVNPNATTLKINKDSYVVQPLTLHNQNFVLNQNLMPIQTKDMLIERDGTAFSISTKVNTDTFSYFTGNISNLEHVVVFDNRTVFNDMIYNLITGLRQQRILVKGTKTADWNGFLDAQGFILNQDNVTEWEPNVKYTKGVIVKYKNSYWTSIRVAQPGSVFNSNEDWVKTDYGTIQKGLLPNPTARAFESTLYYDTHTTNLESDANLLGFSLIGYRPRDYLATANLDDTTQVNVFQNMVKNMGTTNVANNLKGIAVPSGQLDYDIYENWAIKSSEFGGVTNKNFVEFVLNEASLSGNPSIVGLTIDQGEVGVEQEVPLTNLTNYGQIGNTVMLLPTVDGIKDYNLPDAGYVNFNDIRAYAYNYSGLPNAKYNVNEIFQHQYVWLANHKGTWGVYSPVLLGAETNESVMAVSCSNTLNGYITIQFNRPHGLICTPTYADIFAIINFSTDIDGYYTVHNVVNSTTVTVEKVINTTRLTVTGSGIAVKFIPRRVTSPSDVLNLPTLANEFSSEKIWADIDKDGDWAVYQKEQRYEYDFISAMDKPIDTIRFGAAVLYIPEFGFLISDPDAGKVYHYLYNETLKIYVLYGILDNGINYGTAMVAVNNLVLITKPSSIPDQSTIYVYKVVSTRLITELVLVQELTSGARIGDRIVVSGDKNWIYAAGIGNTNISAFRLADRITYTSTGYTTSETVEKGDNQLFITGPVGDAFGNGRTISLGTSTTIYSIVTTKYDPDIGMSVISLEQTIDTEQAFGTTIYYAVTNYVPCKNIVTVSEIDSGVNLLYSLTTNYDGSKIFVGVPNQKYSSQVTNVGYTYVFDRLIHNIEQIYNSFRYVPIDYRLIWTSDNASPTAPMVHMDGVRLLETTDFTITATETQVDSGIYNLVMTLIKPTLAGDIISISGDYFVNTQVLNYYDSLSDMKSDSHFGTSLDCNVYGSEVIVSAPHYTDEAHREGMVVRYTNEGMSFGILHGNAEITLGAPYTILLNGFPVIISGDASTIAEQINTASINNITATDNNGKLIISLRKQVLGTVNDKLVISATDPSIIRRLGITPYVKTQTIKDIHSEMRSQFGYKVKFNEFNSFVISAPTAIRRMKTTFDPLDPLNPDHTLMFDNDFTQFIDEYKNAGAVYMYDYLPKHNESINDIGAYVFSQNITDCRADFGSQPNFGSVITFNNYQVVIGIPDFLPGTDNGGVVVYKNSQFMANWAPFRKSTPVVDIEKLENIQLYDNRTNITITNLDFIDPIQGKLLGSVRDNLDYISSYDPAGYANATANTNICWGSPHVGKMWLDTSRLRFVNYHQDDIVYNSKYWGKPFPGSYIAVYTWVESTTTPAFYVGEGTPYDLTKYAVEYGLDTTGALIAKYYFWVKNSNMISAKLGKTLPDSILERYITDPISSGISFFAPLKVNVFGLYNTKDSINNTNTSIHIGFSTGDNDDPTHSEYQLIRDGVESDFLPGIPGVQDKYSTPIGLYERFLDSSSGLDSLGNVVPNLYLPKLMRRGISVRPIQSLFSYRLTALKNYIEYANSVMQEIPIAESISPSFLTIKGSINPSLGLPFFDTTTAWQYTYWWKTGYSSKTKAAFDVPKYADLATLTIKEGLIVGVTANGDGKREIYLCTNSSWERIGLEDGTISFNDLLYDYVKNKIGFGESFFDTVTYDSFPSEETKYVLRALNEEIYTNDMLIHRNKSLILMLEYIQSESIDAQNYLPWLNKTSFIDVGYTVRDLLPYAKYQRDNIDLLEGYITEVKPYHVVIREFNLRYNGIDSYSGDVSDFDLPAQYNSQYEKFITPELTTGPLRSENQYPEDSTIWQNNSYSSWFNNLGLTFTGELNCNIASLRQELSLLPTPFVVDNAYGFPIQGVVLIDAELIAYTRVERETNTLYGITRGVDGTVISSHQYNSDMYMDLDPVLVMTTSRGYVAPPLITAYVDTSIYPAPSREAKFRAVMALDKVIGIEVLDAGSGYQVTPAIVIQPSLSVTFLISDINFIDNTITISSTDLITGDCVKYSTTGTTMLGLVKDAHYYVRVISSDTNSSVIALYATNRNAQDNVHKINIIESVITGISQLHLTPKAIPVMDSEVVRAIKPILTFDRTSYRPLVKPWEPGAFYSGGSNLDTSASSSISLYQSTIFFDQTGVTDGGGSGAVFAITNVETGAFYLASIIISDPGLGYAESDTITILATSMDLTWTTPDSDCILVVTSVGTSGQILEVSASGTPGFVRRTSSQGAIFPIVNVVNQSGHALVEFDYSTSMMTTGQVNGLQMYFYKSLPPYVYDDTGSGGAIINIYRPKFTSVAVLNQYSIAIVDAGAIYSVNDLITLPGTLLGGTSPANDATIRVNSVSELGAITSASISGVAVGSFAVYYVKATSTELVQIYRDRDLKIPISYSLFDYTIGDIALIVSVSQSVGGSGYSYSSYVTYNNKIYRCIINNSDAVFDYAKWEEIK